MELAWKTFLKFEAAEYGEEGTKHFRDFLSDKMLRRMFIIGEYPVYIALDRDKCIGVISLRNKKHISLLFVDEAYHKCGIATALMNEMKKYVIEEHAGCALTVNAAPYAIGFYHKIGFQDVAPQLMQDGIRYTPMEWVFA
ncbi:MAG: GNAT family N-acetyltransferase [Lachnospiraceae bacterium]|nr:GNAT family N-acetyltransferase [Lachnospiraceae bacterium]